MGSPNLPIAPTTTPQKPFDTRRLAPKSDRSTTETRTHSNTNGRWKEADDERRDQDRMDEGSTTNSRETR